MNAVYTHQKMFLQVWTQVLQYESSQSVINKTRQYVRIPKAYAVLACLCSGEMKGRTQQDPTGFCIRQCAIKRMPYSSALDQYFANAELAALRAVAGLARCMQCFAAFDHTCPTSGARSLWIIAE